MKHINPAELERFWKDVDPTVAGSLDDAQKSAILRAVERQSATPERADIRLSLFGYYMVVLFGRERRSKVRLAEERRLHPLFTWRNLPMLLFLWGSLFYATITAVPWSLHWLLSQLI